MVYWVVDGDAARITAAQALARRRLGPFATYDQALAALQALVATGPEPASALRIVHDYA